MDSQPRPAGRWVLRYLLPLLGGWLALAAGCATVHEGPEPGVIVLRNATASDFATMTVREPRPRDVRPVRMGFVAPLAAGAESEFSRSPDAERLPSRGVVEWSLPGGRRFDASVDIAGALGGATGEPGERLVFEIAPGGAVRVRVEKAER